MNKYKISGTVAAILIIGAYFAGWQTMILLGAFLFIFCELDNRVRDLVINVFSFSIAIELVEQFWHLIYKASSLIPNILTKFVGIINHYLDAGNQIDLGKFGDYVIYPIQDIFEICDEVFGYLIIFAFFVYITSLLVGKTNRGLLISGFIAKYITKVFNYVSAYEMPPVAPVAPAPAPVAPAPVAQPAPEAPAPTDPNTPPTGV